jgi:hypothetical protein
MHGTTIKINSRTYLLQYDRPNACVIAQQYSSATFVSLLFHTYNQRSFCPPFKNRISSFCWYCVLKLPKYEIA